MMNLKTTTEYFNMTTEELQKVRNEYGYTREECKLFDEALKVSFFPNIEQYKSTGVDHELWMKSFNNMNCTDVLFMTDGRIAMLYN